jgi:hypothetical protein
MLLTGWIVGCDLWVKILARAAGCPADPSTAWIVDSYQAPPEGCEPVALASSAFALDAAASIGGPLGLVPGLLSPERGSLAGLCLVAFAVIVTIVVTRWRWRSAGDPLALGALWGGTVALGLPRFIGGGARVTELSLAGIETGLGDIAVIWAVAWLAWRFVAEARA